MSVHNRARQGRKRKDHPDRRGRMYRGWPSYVGFYFCSPQLSGALSLIVLLAARRPVPFKVDISPRFPEVVTLLAAENELRGQ